MMAENPEEMIEFWSKRISALIPCLDFNDERISYGYAFSGDQLDDHPCSRRMDLNATREELYQDLHEVVISTQIHKCGNYCDRVNAKHKNSGPRCRFDFPRQMDLQKYPIEQPAQFIRNPKDGSAEDDMIFIPARNHAYVSNYNPWTSLLWRANNDIQAIFSYHAVIRYLVKYVTKGDFDTKHLHTILANAVKKADDAGKNRKSNKLITLVNAMNNEREISVQEALANITRTNLRYLSHSVIIINIKLATGSIHYTK
jgi:hypothetical protein